MNPPTLDSLAAAKKRGPIKMAEALELLGIARRTMSDWQKDGRVIRPLGGTPVRWPRAEFLAWLDAGCPTAADWQEMKRGERRGALTERYAHA